MIETLRHFVHYGIHFGVPLIIAATIYRSNFKIALIILLSGILIDIDHLWATPLFDPNRCSIGFHSLHQWPYVALYLLLALWPRTRLAGIALLIHIAADLSDCFLMDL
ncbi:DUF6122 family protein [Robertkochia sediminum]|uniref:DUF6122 family protein n=1 Tax=Robertkochia sediminum TaxID=2785326 RepID=UPI0019337FC2|nr:DUF6122 family protein [Robertkochia sediminum]MBL7472165.1 hypothetical protein [Robertkochia sediminum]